MALFYLNVRCVHKSLAEICSETAFVIVSSTSLWCLLEEIDFLICNDAPFNYGVCNC